MEEPAGAGRFGKTGRREYTIYNIQYIIYKMKYNLPRSGIALPAA
jgi:hypothetical protein